MSGIAAVAQPSALSLPLGKGSARPLRDEPAFFLRERGIQVEHEGIGVSAELCSNSPNAGMERFEFVGPGMLQSSTVLGRRG